MKEKERMMEKEKMTLQSINKNRISKKISLQEKGITLIALVVTIIILLILAGVTLNIALSDNGLFSKTKEAAEKYKYAQSDEEEMVRQIATQMYSEYVGAEVTGYTPTSDPEGCTVGVDTTGCESQTLKTESDIKWRIWDFDGNTLRIIGDPTTAELRLDGVTGYNNGVWALDHICKELYSNEEKGAKATTLKRSDIQKISNYDYTKFNHISDDWSETSSENDVNTIQFGETRTYGVGNVSYPELWKTNDSKWIYEHNDNKNIKDGDKECNKWEVLGTDDGLNKNLGEGTANETQFKQSAYGHLIEKSDLINEKYYSLITETTKKDKVINCYWVGTRTVFLFDDRCCFGLGRVSSTGDGGGTYDMTYCALYYSNKENSKTVQKYKLRPMVSINLQESGCSMTKAEESVNVTYELTWKDE